MSLVYQQSGQHKQENLETRRRPHARAHAADNILTSVGHAADDRAHAADNTPSKRPPRLAELPHVARRRSLDQSPSSS